MSAPSVDKCPKKYDEYSFALTKQYREIALDELHESDERRAQSLTQMREWISKNPAIKSCRTDGPFLLRFLRVRKFNVMAACENLERYLAMRQRLSSWFQKLDPKEQWVADIMDDWPILPLGYDEQGRLLILLSMGNFDLEKFTNVHQIRLTTMILESYFEDEKFSIAGCVCIFDYSGITMAHIAAWPILDIKNVIDCVMRSIPIRLTEVHSVCLPRFAVSVGDLILSCMNEKLRKRVHCHRTMEDLTKMVKVSYLPKEYGGEVPIAEFKQRLKEQLAKYREHILDLDLMQIDTSKYANKWKDSYAEGSEGDFGVIGSFRKLNVD